jgi:hypothetical protein
MMNNIKNNSWTIVIAILLLIVLVYLLKDFKSSIEPFTQKEYELRTLLNDNSDGLNTHLNILNMKLNRHVNPKSDTELLRTQQQGLNTKIQQLHDKIQDYDFLLGDGQNNKLTQLNNEINEIDSNMRNRKLKEVLNTKFTGLKSQNNGLELLLEPVSLNKYQIKVNNGCLGVTGTGYDVYNCNPDDTSQHFNLRHIYNDYAYRSEATNLGFVEEPNNIKFPFVMAKSVNNDNCISNNHNNLRVMPCDMVKSQRWNTLTKEICPSE